MVFIAALIALLFRSRSLTVFNNGCVNQAIVDWTNKRRRPIRTALCDWLTGAAQHGRRRDAAPGRETPSTVAPSLTPQIPAKMTLPPKLGHDHGKK